MTGTPDRLAAALADRYVIERELGAGGMATVYLAHDVRHDRKVAVKVLRSDLAAILGGERFLAEIRTTANLQHPHILPLHDSGEADGLVYYVMPYVEGESLRDRLTRETQLPIDDAVAIAREVADALEYAHGQGIVHRDIKPENILLHGGHALVADFGIALAASRSDGGTRMTETGMSLGTPHYMAPEQAMGEKQVTPKADVYALGCVLYETLVGEPPFVGPTAQAIIARVMTEEPRSLTLQRHTVPPHVEAAVLKALEKLPADRFATAAQFAAALVRPAPAAASPSWPRHRVAWVAGAALTLIVAAAAVLRFGQPGSPAFSFGRSTQLTADPGLEIQPAISPDGRLVAYAAGSATRMRVFIRPVEGGRTIPLSDDSTSVETHPRWSPDGGRLLFLTRGGVAVAPSLGGTSRPVVPPGEAVAVSSAAWSPDGREIAFVRADSLQIAPASGGAARFVGRAPDLHSCTWSPEGRWIACVSLNAEAVQPGRTFGNVAPSAILLFPAAGGAPVALVDPTSANISPVWSPDGRFLLFLSNRDGPRDVFALALARSGRARGAPQRLTTGLGAISMSLSADARRMTYALYQAQANVFSLPIPATGVSTAERAEPLTRGSQIIESMDVSRDGRWLVYDSDLRGNMDVYRMPLQGGAAEQLTSEPWDEFAPELSPDGREVAYHSWRTGTRDIEVKPLDGGPVQRVTNTTAQESYPRWSPDGRTLLFFDQVRPFSTYLTTRGADGQWSVPRLLARSTEGSQWSPDGSLIAAVRTDDERHPGQVVVIPVGEGPARDLYEVGPSAPAADQARWSPDGKEIYLKAHDAHGLTTFWAVRASGGRPRLLVRFTDPERQSSRRDFATDGRRLYFAMEDRQSDVYVAELDRR